MMALKRMMAFDEGADYLLDLETTSPRKKRVLCAKLKGVMEDSDLDESYSLFLNGLLEYWEAKFVEEDEDDPTYMMFLGNLKEHGNAYMLDVSMEHGVFFPIMYEVEDDIAIELKRKTPRCQRCTLIQESRSLGLVGTSRSGTKNTGSSKGNTLRCTSVHRSGIFVDGELDSGLEHSSFEKDSTRRRSPRIMEDSSNARRKNPVCKPSQEVCCSSDQKCRSNSSAVTVDEAYKVFLNGLKVIGKSVFYEYGNGKRVYYEMSDQEMPADVEVVHVAQCTTPGPKTPPPRLPDSIPCESIPTSRQSSYSSSPPRASPPPLKQPVPPIAKDSYIMFSASMLKDNGKSFEGEHSWFWKDLKSIVREPYKQAEYEDLLQKVNARSPIEVHRETRTGGYKAAPGPMGKCYLETFPDLECEIEKVKSDRLKVLNLLRGFFFYLKSVPHGVPKPWTKASGKKIMLGSLEDY